MDKKTLVPCILLPSIRDVVYILSHNWMHISWAIVIRNPHYEYDYSNTSYIIAQRPIPIRRRRVYIPDFALYPDPPYPQIKHYHRYIDE